MAVETSRNRINMLLGHEVPPGQAVEWPLKHYIQRQSIVGHCDEVPPGQAVEWPLKLPRRALVVEAVIEGDTWLLGVHHEGRQAGALVVEAVIEGDTCREDRPRKER
jgi:hypothetical protein